MVSIAMCSTFHLWFPSIFCWSNAPNPLWILGLPNELVYPSKKYKFHEISWDILIWSCMLCIPPFYDSFIQEPLFPLVFPPMKSVGNFPIHHLAPRFIQPRNTPDYYRKDSICRSFCSWLYQLPSFEGCWSQQITFKDILLIFCPYHV